MGRGYLAGAAPGHVRAAGDPACWGLRGLLRLRVAGHALRAVSRPPDRGGRWNTDAGPGCFPGCCDGTARPGLGAFEDHHLEQRARGYYTQARQTLLAGVRVGSYSAGVGASHVGVMAGPRQPDLFDGPPAGISLIRPAVPSDEVVRVARRVPENLHFGTSSWTFPGWVGMVYDQLYSVSQLARHGLSAYARHPLLTAVSLDSSFYKVPTPEQIAAYAAAVPEHFRFLVKAYSGLTAAPDSAMALRRGVEPVFQDASFAARTVVKPLVDGLGAKLGAILFQFSPLGPR